HPGNISRNWNTPYRNESLVPVNPPVNIPNDTNFQEMLEEDTSIFAPAEIEIRKITQSKLTQRNEK
ncbi:16549_t:CDS:2, partial [Dentiscutata heterogama]